MKQNGFSIFETSGVLALLTGLVLGVVTVSNYLSERRYALEVLDRGLSSVQTRPIVLAESGSGFATNKEELEPAVKQLAQAIFTEIENRARLNRKVEVRVGYAEVEIDIQSGSTLGLKVNPVSYQTILGSDVRQDVGYEQEFERLAEVNTADQSLLAVPLGSYAGQFLPLTVLLGARVCVQLSTYSSFCATRVTALRGDLGL